MWYTDALRTIEHAGIYRAMHGVSPVFAAGIVVFVLVWVFVMGWGR